MRNVLKRGFSCSPISLVVVLTLLDPSTAHAQRGGRGGQLAPDAQFPAILVQRGFRVERVVGGLTYPTSVAWDEQGRLYVAEGGGSFLEEPPPARILRVENGQATELVNLTNQGVQDTVAGMAFSGGSFYITHRAADRTGAASRVALDGSVTPLFSGIIDSQAEHQVNDVRVGPDGRVYLASGPAGNSGVIGIDLAPFVSRSPQLRTTCCQEIVLTGQNFQTPDFRTPDPADLAVTGAYVPFGTPTTPGQRIPGTNKCGGAILSFDPANPEATLAPFAHGFRNVIGFAWDANGEMFAAVNGYDVRGSRPVNDSAEATYRVRQGAWYGYPDYTADLRPVTRGRRIDSPDALQAPVVINDARQPGRPLNPVIDQAASGLPTPDRSLVFALHEIGSSPSKVDVSPETFGNIGGQVFVAEWGDLAPATSPLRDNVPGYQVVRLGGGKRAIPFVKNAQPGPGSAQGAAGQALERPFDVRFGPDGAMYIVDYGVARVNPARAAENQTPYEFPPQTGAIWRISPVG